MLGTQQLLFLNLGLEQSLRLSSLLGRVREVVIDAQAHQDVSFSRIVELIGADRQAAVNPVFQTMFVFQDSPRLRSSINGLTIEAMREEQRTAKFPLSLLVQVDGEKVRDEGGNRMEELSVTFRLSFPEGDGGDAARELLPDAVKRSHDRLCTVSRTVELGTPVAARIEP